MKLNRLGKLGLNSLLRGLAQRQVVARLLEALAGHVEGGRTLEVGGGQGVGVEIILERFHAASVEMIDIDPDMISRAHRRLASRPDVQVLVGSATSIAAPDESFDAVFDFGAIHQIPNWPDALAEVRRVLKPNGRLYFEEVASPLFRWTLRFTVDGWPAPATRPFSRTAFVRELEALGFTVKESGAPAPLLLILAVLWSGLVGDLVGVADLRRTEDE